LQKEPTRHVENVIMMLMHAHTVIFTMLYFYVHANNNNNNFQDVGNIYGSPPVLHLCMFFIISEASEWRKEIWLGVFLDNSSSAILIKTGKPHLAQVLLTFR